MKTKGFWVISEERKCILKIKKYKNIKYKIMITIFNKISYLLTSKERKRSVILLVLIIMMAMVDVIGIASILPFMAVLTNPTLIQTNDILNYMFQASNIFGIESQQQFLFTLGVIVFILLIFSQAVKSRDILCKSFICAVD